MKGNCNFEKDTYDLHFHFSAQQYRIMKLRFVEMRFWDKDLKRRRSGEMNLSCSKNT
jgi:hypothetical protein